MILMLDRFPALCYNMLDLGYFVDEGELHMAGIGDLQQAFYYQYMINNNSASTMLNAVSGNSGNGVSAASGLSGLIGLNSLYGLGGMTGVGSVDSALNFSSILQSYLGQDLMASALTDTSGAAEMAGQLSDVLEEASKTEDTSSLTYQTVQELYDYFSKKVSARAAALMGTDTESQNQGASSGTAKTTDIDGLNAIAQGSGEVDFSQFDDMVDSFFGEVLPEN